MTQLATHLLFQDGNARTAAELYVSLIPGSRIDSLVVDDAGHANVRFTLADASYIAVDSPIQHAFAFTPSTSLFATCDTAAEVDSLFGSLAEAGMILMPLDDYGFSARFGWCTDRFGVSWQVALA